MITIQYKLYPTKKQENFLNENLFSSIGIYNWAISQITNTKLTREESVQAIPLFVMNAKQLRAILSKRICGHSKICGLSSKLINDTIQHAIKSHIRNKKIGRRTKRKGVQNTKSFQFCGDIKFDKKQRIKLPGLKTTIKTHREMPLSVPKMMVVIKEYNGWYCSVTFDADRPKIDVISSNEVGIDPGLKTSITLSNGKEYQFPRFYQEKAELIEKLQRKSKKSKRLKAVQRKVKNKRKDHHHKLSLELVRENKSICWSDDNFKSLMKKATKFGKKYSDLALYQFSSFIDSKMASRKDGLGVFKRVSNKYSTMTCSNCHALTGPSGITGLKVRNWRCSACENEHDRDINAAMNALVSGRGATANL